MYFGKEFNCVLFEYCLCFGNLSRVELKRNGIKLFDREDVKIIQYVGCGIVCVYCFQFGNGKVDDMKNVKILENKRQWLQNGIKLGWVKRKLL